MSTDRLLSPTHPEEILFPRLLRSLALPPHLLLPPLPFPPFLRLFFLFLLLLFLFFFLPSSSSSKLTFPLPLIQFIARRNLCNHSDLPHPFLILAPYFPAFVSSFP